MRDIKKHPGDWPEDFRGENGQYYNECFDCGEEFTGHRRRALCKTCHNAPRCPDCGERGQAVGHQGCQYPGRFSDPDARNPG